MFTTREEIIKACTTNPEAIADLILFLLKENAELKMRVKALEDQLNKNSRNSSKPPSSDGFNKPAPQSLRAKGKKSVGGQDGHPGRTLRMANVPDHVVVHPVHTCMCGCNLEDEPLLDYMRRQVVDLPPMRVEVTEHQAQIKRCPICKTLAKAEFPVDVTSPVQYGSRLKALGIYLNQYQLLPYDRISEFMEDVFDHSLSGATLMNANALLYEKLETVEKEMVKRILQQPVVHFDETGMSVCGKGWWSHVACTSKLTYFTIHRKRGREAMKAAGILPHFQGTAIHDSLSAYFTYTVCLHALCNAHLLRELIFVLEQEKQRWAKGMIDLLLEAKAAVETQRQKGEPLDIAQILHFAARYDRILDVGFAEDARLHPIIPIEQKPAGKRGKMKQSKGKNLLDRLSKHRIPVLAFIGEMDVPFDNNLAERDQRMNKVQQKISGTFRSEGGAKTYCRIRGYISTVKKHSSSVLDAIHQALLGKPFLPTP